MIDHLQKMIQYFQSSKMIDQFQEMKDNPEKSGNQENTTKNHVMHKMEDIILIFPDLAESIFGQLDNKTLTNCKKVSRNWCEFIDNKKIPWIRRINKYEKNMKTFHEDWKKAVTRTSTKNVKDLALACEDFFKGMIF